MEFAKPTGDKKSPEKIPNVEALNYCLSQLDSKRHCIDAGGHIGTMARRLSDEFEHVHTFEPLWGEYLRQNTADKTNLTIYEVGLGFEKQSEEIYIMPTNTGGSSIVEHPSRNKFQKQSWTEKKKIEIRRVDSYDFNVNVDFMKIDVESYEWHVIKGAEQTLKTHQPLIMVELMPRYEDKKYTVKKTQSLLESFGYKLRKQFGDDFIYGYGG